MPRATSSVAELTAAYRALLEIPPAQPVELLTDSRYVADTLNRWGKAWRKNGWKTRDGRAVANLALVQSLLDAAEQHADLTVTWVRGHDGHRLNETADRLATSASRGGKGKGRVIQGPGWGSLTTNLPANSGRARL